MKKLTLTLICIIALGNIFAQPATPNTPLEPGIYAEFNTTKGTVLCFLYFVRVPMTTAHFIALAEGKLENTIKPKGVPFYNDNVFHRVIPNFMIQGGSGNGAGGNDIPTMFKDEFHPDLKHNRPGILSMANAGPNTNTNQFFITHVPTPWLDNKHSIFGHVVAGQDIVNAMAQGDKIISVRIIRVGSDAQKFDAVKTFTELSKK